MALKFNIDVDILGELEAQIIKKTGGNSNQFLKADGSVDTNQYATLTNISNFIENGDNISSLVNDENYLNTLSLNKVYVGNTNNEPTELSIPNNSVLGRIENDVEPIETEEIEFEQQYILPPSSSTDTGIQGQRAKDDNFIYECVEDNTWVRYAIDKSF